MAIPLIVYGIGAAGLGAYLFLRKKPGAIPSSSALGAPTAAEIAADPTFAAETRKRMAFAQSLTPDQIAAADAHAAAVTGVTPPADFADVTEQLGVTREQLDAAAASIGMTTAQLVATNDPVIFDQAFASQRV